MSKKTEIEQELETTLEPRHIRNILSDIAKVQVDFTGTESRTKSEFKDECNINNIVRQCIKTGVMPSGTREPMFEDFSNIGSYNDAVTQVAEANSTFEQLPSDIRDRFDNSVQNLMDFIADENNQDEAIELGLAPKPEPTESEPEAKVAESDNSVEGSASES
jgi:hypothetical protein